HVGDALAEIDRTLAARAVGWGTFVPGAIWVRVHCLLEQGDVAAAEAPLADRPAEEEASFRRSPLAVALLGARAAVQLVRNDTAAALASWREPRSLAVAVGVHHP